MKKTVTCIDANEATASVAYRLNEVIAIYPITPSSTMGEHADAWSSEERPNIWGTVPKVVEMQSEGGAAGALHGALQAGSLACSFTASQGLLLKIPNMYKIAGELTPAVIHVTARAIAAHALSIFGDHSDVMAVRQTGFGLLASNSVQEAGDMALVAHAATLQARIPFVHFFDGFRTSHEVQKVESLSDEVLLAMIDETALAAHRGRKLTPDRPVIRGTAQNPDVFFQAREAINPYYNACPVIVQDTMDKLAGLIGRQYRLFEYVGAPDAERVVVIMGSGAETAHETVETLLLEDEKVGVLKVRLYRPFSVEHFINALPKTVQAIAVMDRTKEPGAIGEPLYMDIVGALSESMATGVAPFERMPRIIGGRYGLSSKELTPGMIKGVFDELLKEKPKNHFTIGINDDVTHKSLSYDREFCTEDPETVRAVFYGLGSDGTVGANKNSIKIIGENTDKYAQGYFVYDSKKSGSVTVSHLRFGPRPIRSTYLITRANFVACHQFNFLEQRDVLGVAQPGATFLLNSPYGHEEVWDQLPRQAQQAIIDKKLKFYAINAFEVAREVGMGSRINTIMQTCFFAISGVLPRGEAIDAIKHAIEKTYGKRGETVVQRNFLAVDRALANLHRIEVPATAESGIGQRTSVAEGAPDFVRNVVMPMIAGLGDDLPVSAMPVDGTFPTSTTQYEKRNIAQFIPAWDADLCIQCGKCVIVCPHATIRGKIYEPAAIHGAPETFKSTAVRSPEQKHLLYTLQVAPEDCTGCKLCVEVCPAKSKTDPAHKALNMEPQPALRAAEAVNWDYFLALPEYDRLTVNRTRVKDVQLLEPLFEFSGACSGCGETPYIKLMSQLFGDRALIANATGCSSIFCGNLPTTPWRKNREGRGPAWANSLFEDNAEFGMGMRVAVDKQNAYAQELVQQLAGMIGSDLAQEILLADQSDEAGINEQRRRVAALKQKLAGAESGPARDLLVLADALVRKSVWIVGGDGWAYDIGYGGLDHVLSQGLNVNILVLDTEVYSNTGGQMSKSTPRGAVAKFAAGGKTMAKKDLALLAMSYGHVYVARVALGANDAHTVRTFVEAEAYNGPSLILAYSHCIAHGFQLSSGMDQQKLAVQTGYWPLLRFNPELAAVGKNPLQLDSKPPALPLEKYIYNESRYTMLAQSNPEQAQLLLEQAQQDVHARWANYENMAKKLAVDVEAKTAVPS